jgi:hypothetical protein
MRNLIRRLAILAGLGAGTIGLALVTAGGASASPSWGQPYPTPTPTVHKVVEHCFLSLETEHDALPAQFDQYGNQGGGGYTDPAGAPSSDPSWGQPSAQPTEEAEAVEVVQEVRVCVIEEHQAEGYSWGQQNRADDVVTVKDVSGPFAWIVPEKGYAPTPTGLPYGVAGMLTA